PLGRVAAEHDGPLVQPDGHAPRPPAREDHHEPRIRPVQRVGDQHALVDGRPEGVSRHTVDPRIVHLGPRARLFRAWASPLRGRWSLPPEFGYTPAPLVSQPAAARSAAESETVAPRE